MGSLGPDTEASASLADWQTKVAHKQKQCRDAIPREWQVPPQVLELFDFPLEKKANRLIDLDVVRKTGILSDRELAITESYTVPELLAELASGQLTSVEVTTAFSKRAAIAQQLISCLTETFFGQALERARYLDQRRSEGNLVGLLHGLPISLKDSFQVAGTEASIGFVSFLGKKSTENSPIVDMLLSLGAVLYVKTNIPMTLMTADSHNNIFGRTLNPHNTVLSAGGSSGGEGALVAFRGSPLGVGTDVAGSVRIPALCCGTYGFKPTSSRIPYGGQATPGLPGWKPITACAGPLANDFEALEIFTKVVIDSVPGALDSTAIDVPWRQLDPTAESKLRIGVLAEDPSYPLHPPVKRALEEAIRRIQADGHQVIQLSAEQGRVADATEVAARLFTLETETTVGHIKASGEPPVPSVAAQHQPANRGERSFVPDISKLGKLQQYAALTVKRQELSEDWRKLWSDLKLDAVIGPPAQNTAVPHDTYGWPPYTAHLNLLDVGLGRLVGGEASADIDSIRLVSSPSPRRRSSLTLSHSQCSHIKLALFVSDASPTPAIC
ncbi:Acetamidase [Cladophialophora carrionii]|uniref:amidase n=1 Tax=Cladophialophora carrionii TaxID=86049 RepID=A0A1C1CWV6_9EURO|nr:Acetamidase [Cladophialophora carrionii]